MHLLAREHIPVARILFHEDITGKEITSKLLAQVKQLSNVTLL